MHEFDSISAWKMRSFSVMGGVLILLLLGRVGNEPVKIGVNIVQEKPERPKSETPWSYSGEGISHQLPLQPGHC